MNQRSYRPKQYRIFGGKRFSLEGSRRTKPEILRTKEYYQRIWGKKTKFRIVKYPKPTALGGRYGLYARRT